MLYSKCIYLILGQPEPASHQVLMIHPLSDSKIISISTKALSIITKRWGQEIKTENWYQLVIAIFLTK